MHARLRRAGFPSGLAVPSRAAGPLSPGPLSPAPLSPGPLSPGRALRPPAASADGLPNALALPGGTIWYYDGARVLRSTDAGSKWGTVFPTWPASPTALQVEGAFFLDEQDAWAVTDRQWPAQPGATTVWRTTDGGAHWKKGVSLPGPLSYGVPGFDELAFANPTDGFGFGITSTSGQTPAPRSSRGAQPSPASLPAVVYHQLVWSTSDAGLHWQQVPAVGLPWQGAAVALSNVFSCTPSFSLEVLSARVLLLSDGTCPTERPGLWRSSDAGRHWAPVRLPVPPGGWQAAEAWPYPATGRHAKGAEVEDITGFSSGSAVMAVTTRPGQLLVYRSVDAGALWSLASTLKTGSLARPAGFTASSPSAWELPSPAGLYETADAGHSWRLQRSFRPQGLSLPELARSSFADRALGIGWGNVGPYSSEGAGAWLTSDGGKSWSLRAFGPTGTVSPQAPYSTVEFANAQDGWLGGNAGVAATTNGGEDWAPQLSTFAPVGELSFAGPYDGWALTDDQLFATSDGGRQWGALPALALGPWSSVERVSADFGVGVICGEDASRALATYNGGLTWRALPLPGANDLACAYEGPFAGTANAGTSGLCFGTPLSGWAVLRTSNGNGLIEHTRDGGHEWAPVAKFSPVPGQLACSGAGQAWVALTWQLEHGSASTLAVTDDGGQTWSMGPYAAPPGFFSPKMEATDGKPVVRLGTSGLPPAVRWQPVLSLANPEPGVATYLWEEYGACMLGFGFVSTADGGTSWWSTPPRALTSGYVCQAAGLPGLEAALPSPVLALSFPDAQHGFVLGEAAGAPAPVKANSGESLPVALIGTNDGGRTWALLSRFG